jgi:hypothetical protein
LPEFREAILNRLGRDNFGFFNKLLTKGKNMKMMKLTCSLAFALAIALAATGCRNHKPVGVTPLPGSNSGMVGEPGAGGTMNANETGGGATASLESFEGMAADRAALASHTVYFAYDSAAVRKSEKPNLQAVADALESRFERQAAHRGSLRRARHGGIQPVARRTPRAGVARGAGQTWR